MSVALFLYQEIYCRYLAPGEAIIHDRGPEFANQVSKCLHNSFGVDIRVTATGRPQGNGQAEAMVKNLKQKMLACMSENGKIFYFYFFFFGGVQPTDVSKYFFILR
jgi:transposase InsO family protein